MPGTKKAFIKCDNNPLAVIASAYLYEIRITLIYGEKPVEDSIPRTVHEEWRWTHPTYTFTTNRKIFDLKGVEIDPSERLADIDKRNNLLNIKW